MADDLLGFRINVVGDPNTFLSQYTVIAGLLQDWKPAFEEMHTAYAEYEEHVFASQGAEHPRGLWAPLSPRYRAWKEVHYPGRPIMTRTGLLRSKAADVASMEEMRLVMGPDVEYAAPAASRRPFTEPSPALVQQLTEIAESFVTDIIEGH